MLHKIMASLLLLISTNVFAGPPPPPTNASINSWLILAILGLGLPLAAFFFNKNNKK